MNAGGLETERQRPLQRTCMTFSHQLVTRGPALLLRALRGQQMTEARRAAHELAASGKLEALSNGFLRLLHGESGPKQRSATRV